MTVKELFEHLHGIFTIYYYDTTGLVEDVVFSKEDATKIEKYRFHEFIDRYKNYDVTYWCVYASDNAIVLTIRKIIITVDSIDKHLQTNGWEKIKNFKNKKLLVYTRQELDGSTIAIPASEKFSDFYENIGNVLETIAFYENKSSQDLINELNVL